MARPDLPLLPEPGEGSCVRRPMVCRFAQDIRLIERTRTREATKRRITQRSLANGLALGIGALVTLIEKGDKERPSKRGQRSENVFSGVLPTVCGEWSSHRPKPDHKRDESNENGGVLRRWFLHTRSRL